MATAYHHQPLPTSTAFRVIKLQPALNQDEPLRCNIVELDFAIDGSDQPSLKYEALSYCWELRTDSCDIICGNSSIQVSLNCSSALQYLRRTSRTRTLFVDAICVDQASNAHSMSERNHQVKLMGRIYKEASRVLIWIGEGNERMGKIFRRLEQLNSQLRQRINPKSLHGWFAWKLGGSIGSHSVPA
jgi:hypothetical protein